MKVSRVWFFLIFYVSTQVAASSSSKECLAFPENDLVFPIHVEGAMIKNNVSSLNSALSEKKFYDTIIFFEEFWNKEVYALTNKKLKVNGEWLNSEVSAFATRDENNNPEIHIRGGLARHPSLTHDGLVLILCHELGHHLGGAPKNLRGNSEKRSWSSAEGQADYFATSKCLPTLYEKASYIFKYYGNAKLGKCENELCDIVSLAALSVGRVFAGLRTDWHEPKLELKDQTKVFKTLYKHPNPQCRVDTYLAGFNCSKKKEIPFDDIDYEIGSCVNKNALNASRPQCWFNSNYY